MGIGLLLSRDLFFISKVTGTAAACGRTVLAGANLADLLARAGESTVSLLLLDLAQQDLDPAQALLEWEQSGRPRPHRLAFGSHVHTAALQAARDAGCDDVFPRSKFSAQLPEILQQFLSPPQQQPTGTELPPSETGSA